MLEHDEAQPAAAVVRGKCRLGGGVGRRIVDDDHLGHLRFAERRARSPGNGLRSVPGRDDDACRGSGETHDRGLVPTGRIPPAHEVQDDGCRVKASRAAEGSRR
jgi:hypothetical protein